MNSRGKVEAACLSPRALLAVLTSGGSETSIIAEGLSGLEVAMRKPCVSRFLLFFRVQGGAAAAAD